MAAGAAAQPSPRGAAPEVATAAPEALAAAFSSVDAKAVRAHVEFLADDLLEGRLTGTRGHELAAKYVAARLAALGLAPAGDGGTFFQRVSLIESRLDEGTLSLRARTASPTFTHREDFLMTGDPHHADARVEAPLAFAGYGISAPELSHDDYARLDVAGKIAVVLSNAPARFPSEQRAHHASRRLKAQVAAAKGAVGLIVIRTREDERIAPWARVAANPDVTSVASIDGDGAAHDVPETIRGAATMSPAGATKLFADSPVALDAILSEAVAGAPRGFDLPATATLTTRSTHRRTSSPNVVTRLAGADATLAGTSLIYSAHLDHIGMGAEVDGDRIYNGAFDNALGVASLLEVARVLSRIPRPPRSIVFVFVTAEEKGMVGSDYFATHPPAAAGRAIANVNLDMPLLLFPIDKVVAFGGEHSTLGEDARRAAAMAGMTLIPDPMPEQTLFVRSDRFSFVRQGVPSVFFVPAFASSDPNIDGPARFQEFITQHYHRPSDEIDLPMDLGAIERFTRANVALGYLVATSPEAPRWHTDSFFGKTFGRGNDRGR